MSGAIYTPKRGDVVMVDFDPVKGHEQGMYRPAVVVSCSKHNKAAGTAIVVPVTNQKKGYPFEVDLSGCAKTTGVALADHMTSIDWRARRVKFHDTVEPEVLEDIVAMIEAITATEEDE